MKTEQELKQQIINEILESGATYVSTSISTEPCAVGIAIRDIETVDESEFSRFLENDDFFWREHSTGLNEDDY